MKRILLLIHILICFAIRTFPQLSFLDPSFGGNGYVITPVTNYNDFGRSVAIQDNGKIIVAGITLDSLSEYFSVVRYNTDGTLDSLFGSGGKVSTYVGPWNPDNPTVNVVIQNDGRILIAGNVVNSGYWNFELVRYDSTGNLDNTFGNGGIVSTTLGMSLDGAQAMKIQPDGKIILAGSSIINLPSYSDFALIRFNTDGTFDNTFGTNGVVTTSIGSFHDRAYAIALQTDGKIIAAGRTVDTSSAYKFAVIRYDSDGSVDSTFGTNGTVTTSFINNDAGITAMTLQQNGKIVVTGGTDGLTTSDFLLARYNTDGTLDNSFGSGGKIITDISGGLDMPRSIAMDISNNIVVTGISNSCIDGNLAIIRYTPYGIIDSTFGVNGKIIISIGLSYDDGRGISIRTDNKIVVCGATSDDNLKHNFLLIRLKRTGTDIQNLDIENQFVFYPNPSNDRLYIDNYHRTKVDALSIYNMQGQRLVNQTLLEGKNEINISALSTGIYFIEVVNDYGIITKKIIKE